MGRKIEGTGSLNGAFQCMGFTIIFSFLEDFIIFVKKGKKSALGYQDKLLTLKHLSQMSLGAI